MSEEDKTVSIKFYDEENKVVAPDAQSVTAMVDAKGKKRKLEFAKKGDAFVSSAKIPDGDAIGRQCFGKRKDGSWPWNPGRNASPSSPPIRGNCSC